MTTRLLPQEFAEFEPFAEKWCGPTEKDRWDARLASSMAEIQTFYDAFTPRAAEAIAYCDQFSLDALPEDARNLLLLLFSLVQASFPVECWHQARVPDTGAARVDCLLEPAL